MIKTVPIELYEVVSSQLEQALQIIAALTLTDEEVAKCLDKDQEEAKNLIGWADSMKTDLLAPGVYGREALIKMLSTHKFLMNTHAVFIYSAFETPVIGWSIIKLAKRLTDILNDYPTNTLFDCQDDKALKELCKVQLKAAGGKEEQISFLLDLFSSKFPQVILERMFLKRKKKDES